MEDELVYGKNYNAATLFNAAYSLESAAKYRKAWSGEDQTTKDMRREAKAVKAAARLLRKRERVYSPPLM